MPETQQPAGAPAPYVSPKPPVGLWVHWYEYGDKKNHCWPAMVEAHKSHDPNKIELAVWKKGFQKRQSAVMHIANPSLVSMDFNRRREEGAWDYIPGVKVDLNLPDHSTSDDVFRLDQKIQEMEEQIEALRKAVLGSPTDDIEDRILRASKLHPDDPAKVAEICKCTVQKVSTFLSRMKKQAQEASA